MVNPLSTEQERIPIARGHRVNQPCSVEGSTCGFGLARRADHWQSLRWCVVGGSGAAGTAMGGGMRFWVRDQQNHLLHDTWMGTTGILAGEHPVWSIEHQVCAMV